MSDRKGQPEFMGIPLEMTEVVSPLVFASPDCRAKCEGLYKKWSEAVFESAIESGSVVAVFCDRSEACGGDRECAADVALVGRVHDDEFVHFISPLIDNPNAQKATDAVLARFAEEDGKKSTVDARAIADESADKLNRLAAAMTRFGAPSPYP